MATVSMNQPAAGMGATVGYPQPASKIHDALKDVPQDQLLTISLNGREVKARKGETIIEVCHREDTYVPHYCWHPALSIAGNCRLCLVEVEKSPKPLIACQTHVGPGMVIRTASQVAASAQQWMMEFLLVNHPLDCPICDRGGECQLQRYSMEYGQGHTRMADKKRKFVKPQADPLIDIERNRCIMCTRCVRFCDEVGGEHVMGVFDRGDGNYIGTFGQGPVSNIFSGNVIDLCPVGCLTSRPFRFKARVWELRQTQTTCDHCSSGCKTTAWTRNAKLYRMTPPSRKKHGEFTINEDTEEFICNQGRFASDYAAHESRQDQSLIRRAGRLVPTSFDEAVSAAAGAIRDTAKTHGPVCVAFLVSPRATTEDGFLASRLARNVVKTQSIDWRSSFAGKPAADAVSLALDHASGSLEDDPDVIVVVNGHISAQSPVLALRLQEQARRFGRTLVLLGHSHDPYLTPQSCLRFHNDPGMTANVVFELMSALANGSRSEGAFAGGGAHDALAEALGSNKEHVESLLKTLRGAKNGLIVHGLEDFAGLYAPREVPAVVNLAKTLGPGWGYLPVVRDRNAVGLHAAGAEPGDGGVGAHDLVESIQSGRIKGLVLLGADALSGLRDSAEAVEALDSLESLVVIDAFRSSVSEKAGVFIAAASHLERDGVYADIEGNVARLAAAEAPLGGSRPGWEVLSAIGRALGAENFGGRTAEEAWTKTRGQIAPKSTVTLDGLSLEGSSNTAHFVRREESGGARNRSELYNPGSYRTDGLHLRAATGGDRIKMPRHSEEATMGGAPKGLVLTWGTHVSGRGFIADRASICHILAPKPFLLVNAEDAKTLGLSDGQFAILHAGGKKAKVGIKVSASPAPGTVYLPAGTYGSFDSAAFSGPTGVRIEPLDERVPTQNDELLAAVGGAVNP